MKRKTEYRWIIRIILLSIVISVAFTFASEEILSGAGYIIAFLVLFLFIFIGIIFDVIGIAVTSATEAPFHSMSSHRESGAAEAIKLVKNAEKVSSICNDVVGDIAGIVSGTTSVIIVTRLASDLSGGNVAIQLAASGLVAGMTIGGKAIGKTVAINNNTKIVLTVGKVISFVTGIFKKKQK